MTQTTKGGEELIGAAEAARERARANRVGVTRDQIINWEAKGLLKRAATVDGQPVFRRADVLAFVAPSERTDEPQPTTTTEDT